MKEPAIDRRAREALYNRLRALAGQSGSSRDLVRAITSRLLDGVPTAPTDLLALASKLGVQEVSADPDLPLHGELRRSGKAFRILYSKHLSGSKRRFTIAHEIGHAIIESTGAGAPRRGDAVERACDMFAGEILVPSEMLRSRSAQIPDIDSVLGLAKTFDVSPSVLARRCADVFRTAAFEFREGRVSWRTERLSTDSEDLRTLVKEALSSGRVVGTVFLWDAYGGRQWRVEGLRMKGSAAALFLLSPAPARPPQPWGTTGETLGEPVSASPATEGANTDGEQPSPGGDAIPQWDEADSS